MNMKLALFGIVLGTSTLAMASVTHLTSLEDYKKHFSAKKPMVTMFTKPGCPPCAAMKPHLTTVSNANPDVSFFIVDISNTKMNSLVKSLKITGLPTLISSCEGKEISRQCGGLSKKELEQEIASFKTKLSKKAPSTEKKVAPQKKS